MGEEAYDNRKQFEADIVALAKIKEAINDNEAMFQQVRKRIIAAMRDRDLNEYVVADTGHGVRLSMRSRTSMDTSDFIDACDAMAIPLNRAYEALSVRIKEARGLLGETAFENIAHTITDVETLSIIKRG